LPSYLSFPTGKREACHPERSEGSAFAFAVVFALAFGFLSVIPAGNLLLLLLLPLPLFLPLRFCPQFPQMLSS